MKTDAVIIVTHHGNQAYLKVYDGKDGTLIAERTLPAKECALLIQKLFPPILNELHDRA